MCVCAHARLRAAVCLCTCVHMFSSKVPVTFVISLAMYRKSLSLLGCAVLWPTLAPNNTLLDLLKEYSREYWLPIIFGGILQMALTCSHVWTPSAERVASTDK